MKLYTYAIIAIKHLPDLSTTTSYATWLLVALDKDDAETQAMEMCKKCYPESDGYETHLVAVELVREKEILKHPATNTFYMVPDLVKVLITRQDDKGIAYIVDPTHQQDKVKE